MARLVERRDHRSGNGDEGGAGRRITLRGVLAGLFVLLVALVCVRFGFWQLDRLEWRRAQNAALLGAMEEPVLTLDAVTAAQLSREPEAFLYRRVRVEGRFPPAGDVILRGRSHLGQPGVHLLTPLEIEDVPLAVLVNRGWLPAADAVTVDPRPFGASGVQQIEGLVQLYPAADGAGQALEREVDGFRVFSLGRLEFQALQARTAQPLVRFYIQQLPDPSGAAQPLRLPMPEVGEGPHLGYAVQWFSFAAIFLIGFLVVVVRNRPTASPPTTSPGS
jgi:surfeit locus 1 family protein